MAKPAGAIDYSDGGLPLTPFLSHISPYSFFIAVSLPVTYNPQKYDYSMINSLSMSGQIYQYDSAAVESKNTTSTVYWSGPNTSAVWSSKSLRVASYTEDRRDNTEGEYGDLDLFDFRFLDAKISFANFGTTSGHNAEVLTLYFETNNANLERGSSGLMYDVKFHNFGQGGTWSLTDKNMPCSAYLMKKILVENSNVIAYKAKTCFSVPL